MGYKTYKKGSQATGEAITWEDSFGEAVGGGGA